MLSMEPGMGDIFFKAALKEDYTQQLLSTIRTLNKVSEECASNLANPAEPSDLVSCAIAALNQLEILLYFKGDLRNIREQREQQIDQMTNGMLEALKRDIQPA